MKAVVLVKNGNPEAAFELREIEKPKPAKHQVLIKVEAFGLNFADVMARQGMYREAPPMPSVLGYDVVGRIVEIDEHVTGLQIGQRVFALTRFGGYGEFVATYASGVVPIGDDVPPGVAVALATQYATAYYCTEEVTRLNKGDHVLIHAAAGGVGTALVQMVKNKGCVIYGTASASKLKSIAEQGVNFPIDYQTKDFATAVRAIVGDHGLDIIFDPVGGISVKKGFRLLGFGGRIVCFGASSILSAKGNIFKLLKTVFDFGWYSPVKLISRSQSVISVNMLHIGDHRPDILQKCLRGVVDLYENGLVHPVVGGEFKVSEIAQAHQLLEGRKSVGKLVIRWEE
jgi:NADPH:quinone reductase-like Zn-dependent oxidoreductase